MIAFKLFWIFFVAVEERIMKYKQIETVMASKDRKKTSSSTNNNNNNNSGGGEYVTLKHVLFLKVNGTASKEELQKVLE